MKQSSTNSLKAAASPEVTQSLMATGFHDSHNTYGPITRSADSGHAVMQAANDSAGGDSFRLTTAALLQAAQQNISNMHSTVSNANRLQQALQVQSALADVASQAAKSAEMNYQEIDNEVIGYQRRAEINTYYAKQYAAQSGIMKLIVWFAIGLLLIAVLKRRGLLSNDLANLLSSIVFFIGLIMFIVRMYDLSSRNNMNFDEYTFENPTDLRVDGGAGPSVLDYDKKYFLGIDTNDSKGLALIGATLVGDVKKGADDVSKKVEKGAGALATAVGANADFKKFNKEASKEFSSFEDNVDKVSKGKQLAK